jgi:ABC-type multidrug transport system fused ATPase/permease subunit
VDMDFMNNILANAKPKSNKDPNLGSLPQQVSAPLLSAGGANTNVELRHRSGPSAIEFRNVTFQYGAPVTDRNESSATHRSPSGILKGVTFDIKPGQLVAIVGPSGGGKSTIFRLITGLLRPSSGQVLIDETQTTQLPSDEIRKYIGVVPQDTSLFDETIEYNIRYGNL